jgi:DNA-binding IclR family transcriptional regulator
MNMLELSEALSIPKASLWRILTVLKDREYVIFDKKRHTYRLGFKLMYIGNTMLTGSHFRSLARDYLKRLAQETGETVELDVRVRDQLVVVDQVPGPNAVYLYSHPGSAMPYFHATAPGKVYLAHMDRTRMRSAVKKLGLPRLTKHTVQDIEHLEKEIDQVMKDGYAVDMEEMREDVGRVAAPVYDESGRIRGCVAVVCPAFRLKEQHKKSQYGRSVKEVAKEMSQDFGGF